MAGVAGRSGGKREGAGRKPKAERYKSQIQRTEKRIADRLPDIADAMLDLALGVAIEKETDEGKRIFSQPPDYRAASYLMDRLMGKPVQAVDAEVSGPGGGPMKIVVEYVDHAPADDPDTPDPASGAAAGDPGSEAV